MANPNYVPVSQSKAHMEAIEQGKPVNVILDVSDFEKNHANNYLHMLGFVDKNGRPTAGDYMVCTILGEIFNMKGHYVVVGNHGEIVSGLHSDIFYIEKEDYEEFL